MKGTIFEIKRFAVHDGDGIRTTLFLKGCPLNCKWCHNPEGISAKPQLAFYSNKCTLCSNCIKICPNNAHQLIDGKHFLDRSKCLVCGKCVITCYNNALMLYGETVSVETILPKLLEDKDFYDNSNGGVTLSGGECLFQKDFCIDLLKALKTHSIHTAIDTCGFIPKETLEKVIPYTDIFLYDIKAFDEQVHINGTGQSNKLIIENLKYLDSKECEIEIRIPFIPSYNTDEMQQIAKFLSTLKNISKIRILPYHNLAGSKYDALDLSNTLPHETPTQSEIEQAKKVFKQYNLPVLD